MILDQVIHAAMAIGALLVALVGFLAREQLGDMKKTLTDVQLDVKNINNAISLHGERLAGLEARQGRTESAYGTNGRSRSG